MSARVRITLASFLAYCVMSGMLAPIGIVLPPLGEYLGVPVTEAAELFSWLTLGILVGSALALVVFDVLSLRVSMLLIFSLIVLSLLGLQVSDSIWVLRVSLGAVGAGCGIGLAAAASAISLLYSEDRRASMLVITDGAFSVAGVATSTLAVYLVARHMHWASAYLLVAGFAALIVLLAATVAFPQAPRSVQRMEGRSAIWPAPVWLCIAALFLYTLGQQSLLWWLPSHLETALTVQREEAGKVVSRFWSGMLVGQLFVAWWVLKIGARNLVLLCVFGTFLSSLPLWTVQQSQWLPALAFAWGVANLGLLKMVIAFASLTVDTPTPRLLAALLFGATAGTAISPAVTSIVVEALGSLRVLQFGSVCYLILALLIVLAHYLSRPTVSGAADETSGEVAGHISEQTS